jgi:hypothetical protein
VAAKHLVRCLGALGVVLSAIAPCTARAELRPPLSPSENAWTDLQIGAIRGVTIGPIESLRHAGVGYGSDACARSMLEAVGMGATWVSLTPFGRVWDLHGTGVDLTFEVPFPENRAAVLRAIATAHAMGLKVLLIPHLWVETHDWRALIDPGSDQGWAAWAASYRGFLLAWADVAREGHAEMLSLGVELRSFVTTKRAALFQPIIADVRRAYPGLLTYSANWDDVEDTLILGDLDLIGINAFYPLTDHPNATRGELVDQGRVVAAHIADLAKTFHKPIVLTEVGYTTRRDPALEPWVWPDGMKDVVIDEAAQADAYAGMMTPILEAPWAAGFFLWRTYSDPDDVSQEAEWGFSPRGKLAELVLRDAFAASWTADGDTLPGAAIGRHRARTPGVFGWELSPLWPAVSPRE